MINISGRQIVGPGLDLETENRGKGVEIAKAFVKTRNKGAVRVAELLGLPVEQMPKGAAFSIVVTEERKPKKKRGADETKGDTSHCLFALCGWMRCRNGGYEESPARGPARLVCGLRPPVDKSRSKEQYHGRVEPAECDPRMGVGVDKEEVYNDRNESACSLLFMGTANFAEHLRGKLWNSYPACLRALFPIFET